MSGENGGGCLKASRRGERSRRGEGAQNKEIGQRADVEERKSCVHMKHEEEENDESVGRKKKKRGNTQSDFNLCTDACICVAQHYLFLHV